MTTDFRKYPPKNKKAYFILFIFIIKTTNLRLVPQARGLCLNDNEKVGFCQKK